VSVRTSAIVQNPSTRAERQPPDTDVASFELRAPVVAPEFQEGDTAHRRLVDWWVQRNHAVLYHVHHTTCGKPGPKSTWKELAFLLRPGCLVTHPIRIKTIMAGSEYQDDQTWEHLRWLETTGRIAIHPVGGGYYCFEFLGVGGPLGLSVDIRAVRESRKNRESRKIRDVKPGKSGSDVRGSIGSRARGSAAVPQSEDPRSHGQSPCTGTDREPHPEDPEHRKRRAVDDLHDYVAWYNPSFGEYHTVDGGPVLANLQTNSPDAHVALAMLYDDRVPLGTLKGDDGGPVDCAGITDRQSRELYSIDGSLAPHSAAHFHERMLDRDRHGRGRSGHVEEIETDGPPERLSRQRQQVDRATHIARVVTPVAAHLDCRNNTKPSRA
jgi:hypothetical protein